jgi:hypothetical protein
MDNIAPEFMSIAGLKRVDGAIRSANVYGSVCYKEWSRECVRGGCGKKEWVPPVTLVMAVRELMFAFVTMIGWREATEADFPIRAIATRYCSRWLPVTSTHARVA